MQTKVVAEDTVNMDVDLGPRFKPSIQMEGDLLIGSGVVGNKEDGLNGGTKLTNALLLKGGNDKEMNSRREGQDKLNEYKVPKSVSSGDKPEKHRCSSCTKMFSAHRFLRKHMVSKHGLET